VDDEPGLTRPRLNTFISLAAVWAMVAVLLFVGVPFSGLDSSNAQEVVYGPDAPKTWLDILTPGRLIAVCVCLFLSGFFSGSETAFFSLHRLRLRAMREDQSRSGLLVGNLMEHPGRLLTTILVGNTIINIMIALFLGARVEAIFVQLAGWEPALSFAVAVATTTLILVFFGEILPKVFAVRLNELFARGVAQPLSIADVILSVPRDACLWVTNLLFRVTRFHQLQAAPFITDEEFRAALSDIEKHNVIEEDDLQMIQGILESTDAQLKEILTPRPDVTALAESSTVAEALELLRTTEFSRVPLYRDDLDHVTGVLVMKDMLPSIRNGKLERPVKELARPAYFVPRTMTVQQFVRQAQEVRSHMAIVVDEYGGTAGIVTLEDALEEVVGDILDEGEQEATHYEVVSESEYLVQGNVPLDELSELIGIDLKDQVHETLAGFIIEQNEQIPDVGDTVEHDNIRFTVEELDGHRVSTIRVEITDGAPEAEAAKAEEQAS